MMVEGQWAVLVKSQDAGGEDCGQAGHIGLFILLYASSHSMSLDGVIGVRLWPVFRPHSASGCQQA